MDQSDFPDSFRCPITLSLFVDPVLLGSSGQTFEKLEIEYWLQHNNTNPLTNQPLLSARDRELIPNHSLRQSVEHYVQSIVGKILSSSELKVNDKLNEGSQKIVFRAIYNGNIVVVLRVRQANLADDECRMFVRLGCHAHLIRFLGRACLSQTNDIVIGEPNAIVTEFAPLGDLSTYFTGLANRNEMLSINHMLLIAEQVADGMTAVHAAGIIHRDLAARNIMVFAMDVNSPNRTLVKVGDYGLATFTGEQSYVQTAGTNTISPFRWMSPEALRSRRWSKQSDVWSFGVLLWEILTQGDFPYGFQQDSDVAENVANKNLRLTRPASCPDDVWQLVLMCFANEPKDRPSFVELKANLLTLRSHYSHTFLRLSASTLPAPPSIFDPLQPQFLCRPVTAPIAAEPLEPPRHHTSIYDQSQRNWICCEAKAIDANGCQRGTIKYHPQKYIYGSRIKEFHGAFARYEWWCCSNTNRTAPGCQNGVHPRQF